ncbi:MAG: metallophosphoesterase family protein [Longimicrobiales bacterium]
MPKTREPGEVIGTPRSAARSLLRSTLEQERPTVVEKTLMGRARQRTAFLTKAIGKWLINYVKNIFKRRRKLRPHKTTSGVYRMPNECVIGLAADWGTGTESAQAVANALRAKNPAITVHMGDVYYSGTRGEYDDYFLNSWPRGALSSADPNDAQGTYILNANHEMYSGGEGYLDHALDILKQEASFFAVENDHWRVIALDTGYHSDRGLKVFLGGTKLPKENLDWLRDHVFTDPADQRPVILLSHHQWFSAYERDFPSFSKDLQPFLGRVHLWFWGHEHRLAGYARHGLNGAPKVYARCIGHGGMPIELGKTPSKSAKNALVFTDERFALDVDNVRCGFCGFALLRFRGPNLAIEYRDERDRTLLVERWQQTQTGLQGDVEETSETSTLTFRRPLGDLVG